METKKIIEEFLKAVAMFERSTTNHTFTYELILENLTEDQLNTFQTFITELENNEVRVVSEYVYRLM